MSAEAVEKHIVNIRELKDIKHKFTISPLDKDSKKIYIKGRVRSLSVRTEFHFVIHIDKDELNEKQLRWLVSDIAAMVDQNIYLLFYTLKEKKLMDYIESVSALTGLDKEQVLIRVSSFRKKDGTEVEGKKSIFDLSDKQINVVISKLETAMKTGRL